MTKRVARGDGIPRAGASYSQGVVGDHLVAVAGQTGVDPSSGVLRDGLELQTRQALANVESILRAAGCSLSDVIKTTCYLTDIGDFGRFDAVYGEVVPEPWPARATVGVRLAGRALVEVEAWAILPDE